MLDEVTGTWTGNITGEWYNKNVFRCPWFQSLYTFQRTVFYLKKKKKENPAYDKDKVV